MSYGNFQSTDTPSADACEPKRRLLPIRHLIKICPSIKLFCNPNVNALPTTDTQRVFLIRGVTVSAEPQ